MNKNIILGAGLVGLAVILGAFGAHALKASFSDQELNWWNTAQYYHSTHGIALIICGLLAGKTETKYLQWAALGFIVGIFLFSGSLYAMALLPQARWLGAITPLGGVFFIIGWIAMMWSARKWQ